MVDKNIILKTLTEIISNKCRKPSYSLINISNHVKGAMARFARNTRAESIEHGVIIDGHGHPIKEVTGDKTGVFIPVKQMASKVLEEKCKDILEDYQREYDALENEEDAIFLRDKYERRIYERIESLGTDALFHVDHNHPGPYASADLDYNIFTCLSDKDMNNCLLRATIGKNVGDGAFFIENIVKSKTAECSNGSRMTLVNNNPPNVMVNTEKFYKARDNLLNNWNKYVSNIRTETRDYTKIVREKYKGKGLSQEDLLVEIRNDVNEFIKEKSLEIFPKMIESNINEFEELGFELRVDWL